MEHIHYTPQTLRQAAADTIVKAGVPNAERIIKALSLRRLVTQAALHAGVCTVQLGVSADIVSQAAGDFFQYGEFIFASSQSNSPER